MSILLDEPFAIKTIIACIVLLGVLALSSCEAGIHDQQVSDDLAENFAYRPMVGFQDYELFIASDQKNLTKPTQGEK